jgi:hypothetical protein
MWPVYALRKALDSLLAVYCYNELTKPSSWCKTWKMNFPDAKNPCARKNEMTKELMPAILRQKFKDSIMD